MLPATFQATKSGAVPANISNNLNNGLLCMLLGISRNLQNAMLVYYTSREINKSNY